MLRVHLGHDGVVLACRLLVPRRPNGAGVAFAHDWGLARGLDDLHAALAGCGFTAASIEQRGSGPSTGRPALAARPEHVGGAASWLRAPLAHAEATRERAPATVELRPIEGGDHRLETVQRALLFARLRRVLAQGGIR